MRVNKKEYKRWNSEVNIKNILYNIYNKEKDVRDEDKRIYMNKNDNLYVFKYTFSIFNILFSYSELLFTDIINFVGVNSIDNVKRNNRIYRKEV